MLSSLRVDEARFENVKQVTAAYVKEPNEAETLCHFFKCEKVSVFGEDNAVLNTYVNATGSIKLSREVGASISNGKYIKE